MGSKKGVPKSAEHRKNIGDAHRGVPKGPSPHRMSVADMKARIRSFHGNKFDLSLITSDLKTRYLTLICRKHGPFKKGRQDILHTARTGCPSCNGGKKLTPEQFLERARPGQPKWISLKKTHYDGPKKKIKVECKYHGEQECRPYSLIYTSGRIACKPCNDERIRKKRIESGQYVDHSLQDAYIAYRLKVRRLSNQAARKHFINHRSRDLHLEHIFSIAEGFRQKIPSKIIGHITNLKLLSRIENQSKQSKCGKTVKQLYKDYERYEKTAVDSGSNRTFD